MPGSASASAAVDLGRHPYVAGGLHSFVGYSDEDVAAASATNSSDADVLPAATHNKLALRQQAAENY